jgi:hypothetical protein
VNKAELLQSGTGFTLPEDIVWSPQEGFPPRSLDNAVLEGSPTGSGVYLTVVRWHPGYMSAPHMYLTDRIWIVVSGVWWINAGPSFDPAGCVSLDELEQSLRVEFDF